MQQLTVTQVYATNEQKLDPAAMQVSRRGWRLFIFSFVRTFSFSLMFSAWAGKLRALT
jgi:hypothetical protein